MTENKTQHQQDDNARLRAVLETAVDGIITIDDRGTIEAANPSAETLFGYASSELIGKNVKLLMPSPYHEEHDGYIANYQRTGQPKIIGSGREVTGLRKDGSIFPLYLSVSEVTFGHRRVYTGFVHDLTKLRQAEKQATELGRILEASLNEIFIFNPESLQFLFVNRGALANIGYTAEEMLRMTPLDIKPNFTRQTFEALIRPLQNEQQSILRFETVHQRKDGTRYNVNSQIHKTTWQGETALVAMILDLTEETRVRDELAQRDAQLEFMVDHLPAAAAYVDQSSGQVRFNRMIQKISGYSPEELTDIQSYFRVLVEGDAGTAKKEYEAQRDSDGSIPLRQTIRRKDGGTSIVDFRGYRYDHHEVWLISDVTERDRHETELRIRDRAIQAANEGVVIADATQEGYPIIFANDAFESLSGYTRQEAIGRSCEILCGEDPERKVLTKLKAAVAGSGDFRSTVQCRRKNGEALWNELSIAPVRSNDGEVTHIVAVIEDVSERREAQQKLLQSERLAAIGQVVTGLAHESRNALQRAQACLDMLSLDLEDRPEQLELTEKTRRALTDLHRHYEEVRNYAAPINLERRQTDLSKIWEHSWRNVEANRFGRNIQLQVAPAPCSVTCNVDHHRIEQVFRNIIENAIAACPEEGMIRISCSEGMLDKTPSLKVCFQDNGPGFNSETAASVFQPFFTTKQKGTGLGMAISKRIIDAHGGKIWIADSNQNSRQSSETGAKVTVELPRS